MTASGAPGVEDVRDFAGADRPWLAVWDVDRTLTRSDTLVPFLRSVVGRQGWSEVMARVVVDVARAGGRRSALKDALLLHALAGRSLGEILPLAAWYGHGVFDHGLRPDAAARWRWHQDRGDLLVLASASLGVYLRPLGLALGAHTVLATELVEERGVLTGERATANCRGKAKAQRVSDLIGSLSPVGVWAYGDSRSDLPMLALAQIPVRVRPWRRTTSSGRRP